jgi:hypothetical protein
MSIQEQLAIRDQQLHDCGVKIVNQKLEIHRIIDERDAMAHVIVEAGVVPGISYPCRCEYCRSVAKSMAEAGYLNRVNDKWWEKT